MGFRFACEELDILIDAIKSKFIKHSDLKNIIDKIEIDVSMNLRHNKDVSLYISIKLVDTEFEYYTIYRFNKDEWVALANEVDTFMKCRIVKECLEGVLSENILDKIK